MQCSASKAMAYTGSISTYWCLVGLYLASTSVVNIYLGQRLLNLYRPLWFWIRPKHIDTVGKTLGGKCILIFLIQHSSQALYCTFTHDMYSAPGN